MQGRKCPTDVVHPLTYGEETDRVIPVSGVGTVVFWSYFVSLIGNAESWCITLKVALLFLYVFVSFSVSPLLLLLLAVSGPTRTTVRTVFKTYNHSCRMPQEINGNHVFHVPSSPRQHVLTGENRTIQHPKDENRPTSKVSRLRTPTFAAIPAKACAF